MIDAFRRVLIRWRWGVSYNEKRVCVPLSEHGWDEELGRAFAGARLIAAHIEMFRKGLRGSYGNVN